MRYLVLIEGSPKNDHNNKHNTYYSHNLCVHVRVTLYIVKTMLHKIRFSELAAVNPKVQSPKYLSVASS